MAIITVTKDNATICLNVNTIQIINTLSAQIDYVKEKSKGIPIYYNIVANCLYVANAESLELTLGWDNFDKCSIMDWIPTFVDYGQENCMRTYLNWLHGNFGTFTIMYGQKDIIGNVTKPSHILLDAFYNCNPSICIGIYSKNISIVGLQQTLALDLQKVLNENKYIRIYNGKLTVIA